MAELVISDSNYLQHVQDTAGMPKGRKPRDYAAVPLCSLSCSAAFTIPIKPRAEWPDAIADMERTKTRLSDVVLQAGVPSMDQQQTNYCWFNAVVTALLALRAWVGLPYIKLSAASGAAPLKNYRNEGGWGGEALEYITANGICTDALWPTNAISSSYFNKPEVIENRKLHKLPEWYDLESRNFDMLMTALFNRFPSPIGLNWWSHEVCGFDPVMGNTRRKSSAWYGAASPFGVRIRNSWGDSYGEQGFAVLTESKATPDDACAPRTTTHSLN